MFLNNSLIQQILKNRGHPLVLLDSVEIIGASANITQLSEIKSLNCIASKLIINDDRFLKDLYSSIPTSTKIEMVFQAASVLINKLLRDNFDIFPDILALSSVKNLTTEDIFVGNLLRIEVKATEVDYSHITFEGTIETNGKEVLKALFEVSLLNTKEKSLCIIKPDAVKAGLVEQILSVINKNSIKIASTQIKENVDLLRRKKLFTEEECRALYAEHIQKPFYPEIQNFMMSGECVVCVLEGPSINGIGCIKRYRDLMGATDPQQASPGTIRHFAGSNKGENAVHGSDSPEAALREIPIFFPNLRFWSKTAA